MMAQEKLDAVFKQVVTNLVFHCDETVREAGGSPEDRDVIWLNLVVRLLEDHLNSLVTNRDLYGISALLAAYVEQLQPKMVVCEGIMRSAAIVGAYLAANPNEVH